MILASLLPLPLGLFELSVHLPQDQREPEVATDTDDETAEGDDVRVSVGGAELLGPDVRSGNVTQLGDGVEQGDGHGSEGGRSGERAGHPGVHDDITSVTSSCEGDVKRFSNRKTDAESIQTVRN